MKIKKLASLIAKREGRKSQVKIGDVREVLSILSDIICEEVEEDGLSYTIMLLAENGDRRSRKKRPTP